MMLFKLLIRAQASGRHLTRQVGARCSESQLNALGGLKKGGGAPRLWGEHTADEKAYMLHELSKRLTADGDDCPYPPTVLMRALSRVMDNRRRYALRHTTPRGSGDENIPPAAGVIPPAHALLLLAACPLLLATLKYDCDAGGGI